MATRNYLVRKGHIYRPRVRALRGQVIPLDPESKDTKRGVYLGQLEETDAEATGELQPMGPRRMTVDPVDQPDPEPGQAELETDVDKAAAALVDLKVEDLEAALESADIEVLVKAMELEQSKDKPRKGALEAIMAAVTSTESGD